LVVAPVTARGVPIRLPSSINCTVPVGTGEAGVMEAAIETVVPCATVEGVIAMVVPLARLATAIVKDAGAEIED
jgi:hypothetical protein